MLELTESHYLEVTEKLKPVKKEEIFDLYLNSKIASRIKIFGKFYYPTEIAKEFDLETYYRELHFYFEGNDLYTKIGEDYYHTFAIRQLLGIKTSLPTTFSMHFRENDQ